MADESAPKPPKLVKRREHKNSGFRAGRTIAEKREKLETANERAAARKKDKRKKATRIALTIVGFLCLAGLLVALFLVFVRKGNDDYAAEANVSNDYAPTIEIVDEDAKSGGKVTSRMREYIGLVEFDLKEYGFKPTRAVIPTGSIREVWFYLDGYSGYIKTIVDRDAGVTTEDIERMIRYLDGQSIKDFTYIDVRIEKKAYWK